MIYQFSKIIEIEIEFFLCQLSPSGLIRGYLDEQQQQAVLEHEPPRDEIIFL